MLWKKRWFVLSEYCLYYYKGPEEERVSGSILLPSYKISPVSKEDGIHRKFAFKAEHQNMRTYYFAAETKDTMIQWMNALSLASIMQQETDFAPARPHHLGVTPGAAMASKIGGQIHQQQQQRSNLVHNHPPAIHQMYSPNGNAYQYSPNSAHNNQQGGGGGIQPLYANAPPKPRRMNTSRDQSPSPDRGHHGFHEQDQQQSEMVVGRYHQPLTDVHQAHIIGDEIPPSYRQRPPQERRTPEAYGRMVTNTRMRQPGRLDYEDVYNQNPQQQQQLLQKVNNTDPRRMQQQQPLMSPNNNSANNFPPYRGPPQYQPQFNNNNNNVRRPHSADFLEVDNNMVPQSQTLTSPNPTATATPNVRRHHQPRKSQQPPRPKSSIEQRHNFDDYENQFVHDQMAPMIRSQSRAAGPYDNHNNHNHGLDPRMMFPAARHTPMQQQQQPPPQANQYPPPNFPMPSPHDSQIDLTGEEVSRYFPTPSPRKLHQQQQQQQLHHHPTAYQNIPHHHQHQMIVMNQQHHQQFLQSTPRGQGPAAPGFHGRAESVTPMVAAASGLLDEVGEFKRSASARLARNKRNHPEIFGHLGQNSSGLGDDGRRKDQREESMKRLLEWKQRMLQSPLTRKSSRNASRTQTPTNSDSPVPSFQHQHNSLDSSQNNNSMTRQITRPNDFTKQGEAAAAPGPTPTRRVSRKGSGASRSSRSRSSPRISNRPHTSSSDDGRNRKQSVTLMSKTLSID